MTENEMNRVLAAFPDFSWSGNSKIDGLFGGWDGYDQYGYKKGWWTCFEDESLNFKLSDMTEVEFMNYLLQEADGMYICINGMPITEYVKKVRKTTPLSITKIYNNNEIQYTKEIISGSDIEDWILEHDEFPGIDRYTHLIYDHSINYIVITRDNCVELIYPKK